MVIPLKRTSHSTYEGLSSPIQTLDSEVPNQMLMGTDHSTVSPSPLFGLTHSNPTSFIEVHPRDIGPHKTPFCSVESKSPGSNNHVDENHLSLTNRMAFNTSSCSASSGSSPHSRAINLIRRAQPVRLLHAKWVNHYTASRNPGPFG